MIKKIIVIMFILLIFPTFVNATIEAIITGQGVRIRSTPEAIDESNIVKTTITGFYITLVDETTYTGSGCSDGWYKLIYENKEAYVCSTYVNINTNPEYNTSGWTARTYGNFVNVRSQPTSTSTLINSLILGVNLTILEYYPNGNGCAGPWYKVSYYDGKSSGYICSDSVVIKNNITDKDAAYEETLRTSGFPESYFPYLSFLHKKYPNWTFKAIQTGLKWNDVINGENNKNYIQFYNEQYSNSTTIAEVPNWYYANTGVISFYMDPRNFLNEKYIFMFETLNYDNTLELEYPNIVKSTFSGGTFSNDDFANILNTSGKSYNVSPAHIASRIRQEIGINGNAATSGAPFTYGGVEYSGFYNFFNIGAYGDTPIYRGLAYAAGVVDNTNKTREPWNTVEKAINGGAAFLSSKYISKGQYTLYFQKFNTAPNSYYTKYTNQYMTNVQAPSSESSSIYNSYNSQNLLSNAYSFSIPIYLEIPTYTSLPSSGSNNNYLSSITINDITINDFDKDVLEYTYFIDKTINSVNIKATAENSTSKISGDGIVQLNNDSNDISIIVTAENGEIKTYKIVILKVESIISISELQNLLGVVNNDLIPNNSVGNTIEMLTNKINSNSPSSIITVKDSNGTISDYKSPLKTGQLITITTTSNETKTFSISVTGDIDGDGKINILDLLKVQKHLVKAKTLDNVYLLSADTNNDKIVNILDLLRIQKNILGEIKL